MFLRRGVDQLQAPFEELLKEGLREIATVADPAYPTACCSSVAPVCGHLHCPA